MRIDLTRSTIVDVLADVRERFGAPAPTTRSSPDSRVQADQQRRSPKIMIVDDEPLIIDLLTGFLVGDGYEGVVATDDPIDAYSLVRSELPDLLLLDHHMAPVSGLNILAELRADAAFAQLPIVVLTAETDDSLKIKALELGATDFLNKPVTSAELLARLRNILRAKVYEDQLRCIERQKRDAAERELRAADVIQSRLYPASAPRSSAPIDLAGASHSAGAGCGDYFDFLELANGSLALVVGDVSGHGMPAALRMIEARAYLRSLAKHESNPGRILSGLNQFMIEEAAYGSDGGEQFVTLLLAAIDRTGRELVYASAGHAGYVVRESKPILKLSSTGLPLGIAEAPIGNAEPIALEPGDVVLLTTDGIEEAMSPTGRQFGSLRLLSTVRASQPGSAQRIVDALQLSVKEFLGGAPQRDDVTVVVAKMKGAGATVPGSAPVCADRGSSTC